MAPVPASDLPDRFRGHVASARLFAPPGRVLVAVSGGPDSLALLFLLHATAEGLGLDVVVGHTDHGIHPESARWAAAVADVAAGLGRPLLLRALALGAGSGETRARAARYAALRSMQQAAGAPYLATAHHADDQAETVMFRLLRGSGPAGLAGIPARGPDGLRRPLLPFAREELREWLAAAHPAAVPIEDPANADERHDRVWIRRVAMPLLRTRFPDAGDALRRTASQAASQRRAWEALLRDQPAFGLTVTPEAVEVERSPFSGYHNTLSAALLRSLCGMVGCRVRAGRLAALLRFAVTAPSGRVLELGDEWTAETVFGRLRIARRSDTPGTDEPAASATWGGSADAGEARWGQWGITWCREPAGRVSRATWSTWILGEGGEVRAVRAGDALRPLGGTGRRSARRLLMEARVPRAERARYPLVAQGDRILWIPGVCRGDVALPRPGEPAVRVDVRRFGDPEPHGRSRDRGRGL
ncbi:MAG TPA: tRNA lysidine(34) synthetase TilS [Gemmatimonadales bacterium]|jgi:tRNA(Ile)-lysidine synthase